MAEPDTEEFRQPEQHPESLDRARLRFERQKLALELHVKRRELAEQRKRSIWKDLLANPLSVAIVGGILTLMTTIVTNFLTAWANRESARQTLQADLVKKFVEGPRPETVRGNLRFLAGSGLIPDYAASIEKYLEANPSAAPQVGTRLDFSPSGEAVPETLQKRLRDAVERFRTFLQSKGFMDLDGNISVYIYSEEAPVPAAVALAFGPDFTPQMVSDIPNSLYHDNTLYIHKDLSDDLSLVLREFSHHALTQAVGREKFRQTAIESALADYLPATFLKSPVIGAIFAKLSQSIPGPRTLTGQGTYDAEATKGKDGWFTRGIVWAQALWACRNPDRPEGVDNLILPAWQESNVPPIEDDLVEARFGGALAAAPSPEGTCFGKQIAARRLPLQR